MPTRDLPSHPDVEQLRTQAKELVRAVRAQDEQALALVREFHPAPPPSLRHADALLVVARRYGFASWPKLKAHVELLARHSGEPHRADPADPLDRFLALACLTYGGDDPARREQARQMLTPELLRGSIHGAAAAGDVTEVRSLLAGRSEAAHARGGPHRWEPLLYLAYSRLGTGDALAVARALLEAGADPNAGYLWEGHYAFTALTGVLGEGEDAPNQPRHPQWRPLATLLLDAGANANDSQGLYNRMFGDTDEHLELLLARGLGRGDGGPWYRRFPTVLPSPAQMLEDQLLWAAEHGLTRRAAMLLEHGCDPDGTGFWFTERPGGTALRRALDSGSTAVVALLRAAGARELDVSPAQALLAAALAGDRQTVAQLRTPELLAEIRRTDRRAIRRAVELRRPEAIRLLAELGFDVNAGKRTALHEAAYNGLLDVARLLIELGADPTKRDDAFDATAQGWAEHAHHDDVAAYLAGLA